MKKFFAKTALILPPIFKRKKTYKEWIVYRILMIILAIVLIGLVVGFYVFFHQGYRFSASNQSYSIYTDYHNIKLKPAVLRGDMVLLFCFDINNVLSLEYIESLKNLHNEYKDLKVMAILNKPIDKSELNSFIEKYELPFLVFNPSDKKHLVQDLYQKMQEHIKRDSPKDTNMADLIEVDEAKLPFLLLYDRKHRLYEHYQGAVVQEMLMFDIAQAGIKE